MDAFTLHLYLLLLLWTATVLLVLLSVKKVFHLKIRFFFVLVVAILIFLGTVWLAGYFYWENFSLAKGLTAFLFAGAVYILLSELKKSSN